MAARMVHRSEVNFRTLRSFKTNPKILLVCMILCMILEKYGSDAQRRGSACSDYSGRAKRCTPPFENAAFGGTRSQVRVVATNTCGLHEEQGYCLQTGVTGATKSCDVCNANDPTKRHPASALTDFHDKAKLSWWQSETMLQGVQYPNNVNLTLHLGKSFDITYITLTFHSSRPESFAIYKRTTEDSPWIPYQYYSASCLDTFRQRTREIITTDNEQKAICTDEYSDISPLTGGSVAFSTLEGRPSAYKFENSLVLQDWVSATDIKIVLTRINTFGDEVFGDPNVLRSYFYAISDLAVGGKCKCNGHASECVLSTGQGLEDRLICRCEHHTTGPDCDKCDEFYNDQPWKRATKNDAHECQACDCNGLSNRCYFDEAMWRQTGHGGHCLDCRDSTAGPHCERCKDFYFRRTEEDRCLPCNCDSTGSENEQCDSSGRCRCKPGVTGEKCDRCMPNFYDFGPSGCRPCACLVAGSRDNNPVCLANTGVCTCKDFVEGQNCDVCKPGYFNLEEDNSYGCMACFCYGHSSICTTATGFSAKSIHTDFDSGRQRWTGIDRDGAEIATNYNGQVGNLGISAPTVTPVFFVAPDRYLGDQRFSYNQFLEFTLRLGEDGAQPSIYDVVIEGDGHTVSTPIYSQGNPVPRTIDQEFRFRLSEHQDNQWSPSLSSFDFISMLSNLTAIKIRGSYTSAGNGFLDNVRLHSARLGQGQSAVSHVEQCTCPEGYIGQFCESCGPGYHRDPRNGGPMARCVPCNCNGHSDACDVNTGECICQHNTAGENCERCAPGYYGYALAGTEDDCKQCPCPGGGECVELLNKDVVCINCQEGYTGPRCEMCADGYSGDPEGRYGPSRPCEKCTCNENIDPNAVANCNRTTGECLKCIYNTGGFYCDKCLPGYYGDALELPKGQCQACSCYVPGSVQASGNMVLCHPQTGQCPCLPNIIGRQCESCIPGYWNINSGFGCEPCRCDLTGSFNNSCEIFDGKCPCRPGIVGRRCDDCQSLHYGFSDDGCKACECDPEGSVDLQCDGRTGQCPCKPNIEGDHCDRCEENKYNITAGCIECPACYSLVQDRVHILRTKLNELRELINNIGSNPGAIDDTDFRQRIAAVNATVSKLLEDARAAIGSDGPLADQLLVIQEALMNLMNQCGRITDDVSQARTSSQASMYDISGAERAIEDAERALRDAESYIETEGQEALRQAREAQEKFGQQSLRMTDIAKQARQEAERQEEEAKRIEDTAKKALNTSQEALAIAREALQKPQDTARDIDDLRRDVTDSERLYDQTKAMSERALKQAEDAYQDSLDILTEADSVELPDIDVESQTDEAQNIKDEAQRIKEEADRLIDQHRDLMDDVFQQQTDAEDMLENGIRQQQIADELLADADVARDIARDAIAKAEKTLEDAYDTLETLKGFDEKVQKSKSAAEDALKRIPNIERQIQEAELKTRDAENNLAGAEADANMARDIAQEARNVAEMASEDADDVRGEAAKTKQRAVELKDKADDLSKDVEDLERRLRELENQAADDERLAKEALEKADQAKISADDSSSKVSGALDDVNDILDKLANLNSIDTDRLDDLEKNLEDAEQRLIEANLEQRYNSLLVAVQQQTQWSRNYNDELGKLRLDVQNIEKINETIPRDCFRGLELEPTDPSQAGRQRRNHRRRNRNRFFS